MLSTGLYLYELNSGLDLSGWAYLIPIMFDFAVLSFIAAKAGQDA